jgi:uncharacterized heparinase superfamily protein
MMVAASRLYHTVVHLKPGQIYGRPIYKLRKPKPWLGPAPLRRSFGAVWNNPIEKRRSLYGPRVFRFIGREGTVASAADWNNPHQEKLWLYNLHYFDDLTSKGSAERTDWHRALLDSWISGNPIGQGNGWEAYPVSLRIVNWIKWALGGAHLETHWLDSLAVQARWLERRLEWHLLGNHLVVNAKALIFAGLFFEGSEAEGWLEQGLLILSTQLLEQVLADGGHFELSPMYHSLILEDLLDLINLARTFPGMVAEAVLNDWQIIADNMRRWLGCMTHPDGRIAFFNDAAFGIAAERSAIEDYARRLRLACLAEPKDGVTQLAQSGYVRFAQNGAVAILDVAAIGPDHAPGHAHADTLSFELSLERSRIIVNSGTSCYAAGPQRHRERSTAAHSTVEFDGQNSSEVWASFRVARRARVFDLVVDEGTSKVHISCSHNGYSRLRGSPIHRREWEFANRRLKVTDHVPGGSGKAIARFHLSPSVEGSIKDSRIGGSQGLLRCGALQVTCQTSSVARLEASEWHPEFGQTIATSRIDAPFAADRIETEFNW